jgi:hypothetical protein
VAAELSAFIESLEAEQLVVPDPLDATGAPLAPAGPALPWEPLALETFTDMQELILLDPVHEVEPSQGWPVARTADPPA